MRIRAPKDFWSGVMFCGFAAVAILAARGYSLGTAGKMGPGYFPLVLGGVLIEPLGLVLSLVVLTLMSASAGAQFRLPETLALTVLLIVFSAGVFVYALGLPLNIWPSL